MMKIAVSLTFWAFCAWGSYLFADAVNDPKIIGKINDGSINAIPISPRPEWQNPHVLETENFLRGNQKVTIQKIIKPDFRVRTEDASRQEIRSERAIPSAHSSESFMAIVEATVYDSQYTKIRFSAPRVEEEEREVYVVWSNINWHHLEGFSSFTSPGYHFSFILLASDARLFDAEGNSLVVIPDELKSKSRRVPHYFLEQGDSENTAVLNFLEQIHKLYILNKPDLRQAHFSRLENARKRQREIESKPPEDEKIKILYWDVESR